MTDDMSATPSTFLNPSKMGESCILNLIILSLLLLTSSASSLSTSSAIHPGVSHTNTFRLKSSRCATSRVPKDLRHRGQT